MVESSVTSVRLTYEEFEELDDCQQALRAAVKARAERQLLDCVQLRWSKTVDELRRKFRDAEKAAAARIACPRFNDAS